MTTYTIEVPDSDLDCRPFLDELFAFLDSTAGSYYQKAVLDGSISMSSISNMTRMRIFKLQKSCHVPLSVLVAVRQIDQMLMRVSVLAVHNRHGSKQDRG